MLYDCFFLCRFKVISNNSISNNSVHCLNTEESDLFSELIITQNLEYVCAQGCAIYVKVVSMNFQGRWEVKNLGDCLLITNCHRNLINCSYCCKYHIKKPFYSLSTCYYSGPYKMCSWDVPGPGVGLTSVCCEYVFFYHG